MDGFRRLVGSLDERQWAAVGRNHPARLNDEDEGRPVGVIAHHVAANGDFIIERIRSTVEGRPLQAVDFKEMNARHAAERAGATAREVLDLLSESKPRLAALVRAMTDDQLDLAMETPRGPLTVAERIERVLIGHLESHQGSIEAAVS